MSDAVAALDEVPDEELPPEPLPGSYRLDRIERLWVRLGEGEPPLWVRDGMEGAAGWSWPALVRRYGPMTEPAP